MVDLNKSNQFTFGPQTQQSSFKNELSDTFKQIIGYEKKPVSEVILIFIVILN